MFHGTNSILLFFFIFDFMVSEDQISWQAYLSTQHDPEL